MSELLIGAILAFCPGFDVDHKGQTITTVCQEYMTNCIINEAKYGKPTEEHYDICRDRYTEKIRIGSKVVSSDIEE